MHNTILIGLGLVLSSWTASASRGSRLNPHVFSGYCHRFREAREVPLVHPIVLGEVSYQPTVLLDASQTRYSFWKMRESMRRAIRKKTGNYYDKQLMQWQFAHDLNEHGVGRSLFPREKFLVGILWRGRIFLTDGHHKALMSSYLAAPTVPIKITADWSDLERPEFIARMGQVENGQRHAYWRDYLGHPVDPVDLAELSDDPNLLLARKCLQRVDAYILVQPDGGEDFVVERLSEAGTVLALKIGNDESFFEARLADGLRRHGKIFDNDLRNEPIPKHLMSEYHQILLRERDRPGSDLANVLLLDKPRPASRIDVADQILKHVRERNCEHLLERRVHTID